MAGFILRRAGKSHQNSLSVLNIIRYCIIILTTVFILLGFCLSNNLLSRIEITSSDTVISYLLFLIMLFLYGGYGWDSKRNRNLRLAKAYRKIKNKMNTFDDESGK